MTLQQNDKKQKEKEVLVNLLEKGVMYEEDFVETYMNLLKEKYFIDYFKDKQERAKELLNILIKDSQWHKSSLEQIIAKLK